MRLRRNDHRPTAALVPLPNHTERPVEPQTVAITENQCALLDEIAIRWAATSTGSDAVGSTGHHGRSLASTGGVRPPLVARLSEILFPQGLSDTV